MDAEWHAGRLATGIVRCYVSPNRRHVGTVLFVGRRPPTLRFGSDLTPEASVSTSNGFDPEPPLALSPRTRAQTPWIRDVERLWQLHLGVCQAGEDERFQPVVQPEPLEAALLANTRRVIDLHIANGRLKRIDSGGCRVTLRAVIVWIPVVCAKALYYALFYWFPPTDQAVIARARRQFRRIRDWSQ